LSLIYKLSNAIDSRSIATRQSAIRCIRNKYAKYKQSKYYYRGGEVQKRLARQLYYTLKYAIKRTVLFQVYRDRYIKHHITSP
jgi:hypothetical protein